MQRASLEVVYVYHSCFALASGRLTVLLDYPSGVPADSREVAERLARGRRLLVLFTHSHSDHFSPDFTELAELAGEFACVASRDVAERCLAVEPGDHASAMGVDVWAFGSSDVGASFVLRMAGRTVYAAGDNAYWVRAELPEELNRLIGERFYAVLREVRERFAPVDVALTPLCPACERLGGVGDVAALLRPALLVPTHLRGEVELLRGYASYLRGLAKSVFLYSRPGDVARVP